MSFYGTSFSFDGISCEEFGLMLYDLDSSTQGESSWATGTKIKEERIPGRVRSIYYGKIEESNLEFTLIFGADEHAARAGEPIDRYEMQAIAWWLTGPDDYRYLQIDQPDMAGLRYRCMITDLKMVELYGKKWGFTCKVHCDSPYAYTLPRSTEYTVSGDTQLSLYSPSTVNIPYYPVITVEVATGCTAFSLSNAKNGSGIAFADLPASVGKITVDGERGIITSAAGFNLYPYVKDFSFLSVLPGWNQLAWKEGSGSVTIEGEFPMNVGG